MNGFADIMDTKALMGESRISLGIVLGSGLSTVSERIEVLHELAFSDIPGFPVSTIPGHAGKFLFGRLGNIPVACMQGRFHLYEGHDPEAFLIPMRFFRDLGIGTVVLTNAAGSLTDKIPPGNLMLISDHINLTGKSPLTGIRAGNERFIDMSSAYDEGLRKALRQGAANIGLSLGEGVYACLPGPNFETPAEVRMTRILGADAVGMSTVPECIAARFFGLRVAGISMIVNMGAGMTGQELSHEHTLEQGRRAAGDLADLLVASVGGLVS